MVTDSRPRAADDSFEVTLALPILPGKLETWRRFCQELSEGRRGQREALREKLGVVELNAYLLRAPASPVALLWLETEEPQCLLARMGSSQHPFLRWLRRKLREIHGLDLGRVDLKTKIELIVEWKQY